MTPALAVTALVLGVLSGPAGPDPGASVTRDDARAVRLGIGEQLPDMFADARWGRLRIRDARYLAPWDALAHRRARAKLDGWVAAARAANARITLSLRHARRARRDPRAFPTDDEFRSAFRAFRARYPDIRDWIVWNEANHPSSLSARRPGRIARLFDIATTTCPRCRIVGGDLLDIRGMVPWARRFLRHARHRPRIWGLHNYVDANRGRTAGTNALIEATRGTIWFTETGGLRLRRKYERRRIVHEERFSARHGARALRHALSLACLSRRVRRVYVYNWQAPRVPTTWDSGLIGPRGNARPAFHALAALVRRARAPVIRCRAGALVAPRS